MVQVLRYAPVEEWAPPGLPLCVDMMIVGRDRHGHRQVVAIEVDGPQHYESDKRTRTQATMIRDAVLLASGIHVRLAASPGLVAEQARAVRKDMSQQLAAVQVVTVPFTTWDTTNHSGHGLSGKELRVDWLAKELEKLGVSPPDSSSVDKS